MRSITKFTGNFLTLKPSSHLACNKLVVAMVLAIAACLPGCARQQNHVEPASTMAVSPMLTPRRPPSPSQSHQMMLEELREVSALTNETVDWLGDSEALDLRLQLAQPTSSRPTLQEYAMRIDLAGLELRLGNELEAIEQLKECHAIIDRVRKATPGDEVERLANDLDFMLGVTHLRLGETQNCCNRNTPDSCIAPIRGEGIHSNAYGSSEAIRWFERVLRQAPERSILWLRAVWLYNIAHMTLGQYPEQVAAEWQVPAQAFESDARFPSFTNIAQSKGLATFSLAGGAIVDDFNGDCQPDVVVSSLDTHAQIRYFSNYDAEFVDCTKNAGLTGLFGGLNLVQADYNNDGFLDVLVLRGGWFQAGGRHPKSLLRNNGDGTFTDITFSANLRSRAPTQTASWADFDNDGDLDLYIGNETTPTVPIGSQLFENNADGTFTDIAEQAGVLNNRFAKAVVWGDYDNDRLADIYVSNFGQPNRLYHNQGNGAFVDVAQELNVTGPLRSFPAWFWDFDNDGALDLFVSSYGDDVAWLAAHFLKVEPLDAPYEIEPHALYKGNGSGGFANVSERCQLTAPTAPMGSNFGDLDNDGFLDFYLGTGEPEYRNLMPNVMYHNQLGERFADVTMPGRFGHLQKGHAVAFADLDQDGDQDVFEQMGGAFPGDGYFDALFENPGFGNNWIDISVVGRQSNRAGIGARLHLQILQDGSLRSIYKHVNSGGSFGGNPLVQSIGLGSAQRVESLEVFWPATGRTQTFEDLVVRQAIRIVEGQDRYVRLPK